MRLKMRIVLFCLVLISGVEMQADSLYLDHPLHLFLMPEGAIPERSLILYERVMGGTGTSPVSFGYEWAKLIAEADTIPVKLIDSCGGDSRRQWLFKPERGMMSEKQYVFCILFGWHDKLYGSTANCFILKNPIQDCAERNPPEMHGIPHLVETQDSVYYPFKKVFVRINVSDENEMLLKAVYTDRITGEKWKRYFRLNSIDSDTGSVVNIGLIDLNTSHTFGLEITLIDLYGNQSTPLQISEDVRFIKGGRYVYGESNDPLIYRKMTLIIGLCILFALGCFYYRFNRLTKKSN